MEGVVKNGSGVCSVVIVAEGVGVEVFLQLVQWGGSRNSGKEACAIENVRYLL